MRISWKERLEQQPSLRDFAKWPIVPIDSIPVRLQKRFLRNQHVMIKVLSQQNNFKTIATEHQLSPGRVSQLLDRCLGGEASEPPALTSGCIPHKNIINKERQQELPTVHNIGGAACAFKALLQTVPNLQESLDAIIKAEQKDHNYAQHVTPCSFHGDFKRLLVEANWPRDLYPYTTESLAYESVRRYLHQRRAALERRKVQIRKTPPRNLGVPTTRYRALRAIQIDEHMIDDKQVLHLVLNDELIPLRLARASIIVAIDVDTKCVLGYHFAHTRHPNQQDLLTLFDNCIQPWQPLELTTSGLSYAPGATFPSALNNDFPISFGTVQLDNAWMHHAKSVVDLLCETYGATVSYGLPAMPTIRGLVESTFNYINQKASHRMASTTGSHPTDPIKESRKNLKHPPVTTFQTFNEVLSVILTEYNVTPKASLGYVSPLELFQHHCDNHFVRFVPSHLIQQFNPFIGSKVVPLHWYRHENRVPHVNFYYERYQGPGLLDVMGKEKKIRVQFDRRDIRTLRAYTLSGKNLGDVQAGKSWQRFPHSLATRQWIHKNAKEYRLNIRDPLSSYFDYLLQNKGKPKMALSLLRVYNEFTQGANKSIVLEESDYFSKTQINRQSSYTWNSKTANHKE